MTLPPSFHPVVRLWHVAVLTYIAWLAGISPAPASVYLEYSAPGPVVVSQGGTLQITLNLVTTAEQVMGLDYRLTVSGSASGYFTLTGRDLSGSAFSDPVETNPMVLAPAAAVMDPENNLSLGAWTPTFNPVSTGTWQVAVLTISIAPNAPLGSFTLQTISPADAGWFDENFEDHEFDSPASITVNVVPEPGTASALLVATLVLSLAWRRRHAVLVIAGIALAGNTPAEAQAWPTYEYRQFNNKINYRLCKPKNYDPSGTTKYPLVIFWHGNGQTEVIENFVSGDPTKCNSAQMADCGQFEFMSEANQALFPCFLILPQRKTADGVDTNTPALAASLVDALAAEFPIDADRVIVTGLSGGGGRTLACAVANPTKYAAIVPLSTIISGGSSTQVAAAIQNIPMWFFHSANDGIVGIGGTSDTLVRDLRKIGSRPIYTRYALGDHTPAMWKHSYQTPPLVPWLAQQRRGQAQKNDPARVVIHQPTSASNFTTSLSSVPFSGAVEMNEPGGLNGPVISKVEWAIGDYHISSNRNPATGTASWTANSPASLSLGSNVLEAVAIGTTWAPDYLGATYYSATLLVTRTNSGDFTAPSTTIISPTRKATWKTKAATINLAGTAADNTGVVRVAWRNSRGTSGSATGTNTWQALSIPLERGENILTISAIDASGNAGTDTLTVNCTRADSTPSSLWTGSNVGEGSTPGVFPGQPGSFSEQDGTMTIRGSGSTMWGVDNQFYFVHQPVSGDFQMTARLKSQQASGQGSAGGSNLAGLLVTDTLTRNARYALIGCGGGSRAVFRSHYGPNDTWGGNTENTAFTAPCWLRLTRAGTIFTSEVSSNGTTWTAIAPNENIGIPTNAYLGFGVNSADNSVLSTAVFDNIVITKGAAPKLISAASRLVHGSAGPFDIDLPASAPYGIESRMPVPSGTYSLRLIFDRAVTSATATVQAGTGIAATPIASGNVITVNLSGVSSGQTMTLKLQNVVPQAGGAPGNATVSLAFLPADANASRNVTAADAALVKSWTGQPVSTGNARGDIDADGDIDSLDQTLVKASLNTALP